MNGIPTWTPAEIEAKSFAIIEQELQEAGICLDPDKAPVIKRAIHTSADFDYAKTLTFSDGVVDLAKQLLREGCDIVTDTNMALTGINKGRLAQRGGSVYCWMAEADVASEAKKRGVTRASVSMERAAAFVRKSGRPTIFAIGNAPTALITLRDLWEEEVFRPDLVIGVPVGFVHVVEAKEGILGTTIPSIINRGRKGGSNIAAAIVNALLYEAAREEKGDAQV